MPTDLLIGSPTHSGIRARGTFFYSKLDGLIWQGSSHPDSLRDFDGLALLAPESYQECTDLGRKIIIPDEKGAVRDGEKGAVRVGA